MRTYRKRKMVVFVYLSGESLARAITQNNLLQNFTDKKIGTIAYDLTVEELVPISAGEASANTKKPESYELAPQETIFVGSREILALPPDCFAVVTPRNSCIRQGLDISAPAYQPGHKTRVYIRVTNLSGDAIHISKGDSVSSLMFYKLDAKVERPYDGTFSNEFNYKGVGRSSDHAIKIPKVRRLEKKLESIQDLEKSIYGTVITIMTVFIAIFSIINLNAEFLSECDSIRTMFSYDLITLGAVFALVGLVVGVLNPRAASDRKRAWVPMLIILVFAVLLFLGAAGLAFL